MESHGLPGTSSSDNDHWSAVPRRPSIGVDPHSVEPASVLSLEEMELLQRKFARFNPNTNKTRALSATHAMKLFRDDFPSLSEWETQELFQKCDLNCDGHLALQEYLQTRAYHRLVMEAESELDIVRSFTILDTDSDGLLVADEVLALVEQSKQPGARLLKQVVQQAADATREATTSRHQRSRRVRDNAEVEREASKPRGEITLEHFVNTIRDINRGVEQEIAKKTLRIFALEEKLDSLQKALQDPTFSALHLANLVSKINSTRVELDVVKTEVARYKKEVLLDSGQSSALGTICETLVATYDNEQHVYECLSNFITYCGLKDPVVFRYNLEQSGREVHVLDSILMTPPAHVKRSAEYTQMMELAIHHMNHDHANSRSHTGGQSDADLAHHSHHGDDGTDHRYGRLKLNSTLRRQFVYYTMLGEVTNLESMTRSAFLKFVKDCELHVLTQPPLTDHEIGSRFSEAISRYSSEKPRQQCTPRGTGNMLFASWLVACDLIFQHALSRRSKEPLDADHLEFLMKTHVIAKAKCIQTQNIAPDVSQGHVLKLLRENLWQFRQIFFHFGAQSLLEVDSKVTLDMHEFLTFARAFKILRASAERDGEPYSPPPLTESAIIQPISLMELIREFYAAKLDISFSNPFRREKHDLNFREFSRCIQRIALAMHANAPDRTKTRTGPPNGIASTSFEAVKEDDERQSIPVETPLYNRRGNMLGVSGSPTKSCKMTSTSMISKLLNTSRALATANLPLHDNGNGADMNSPPAHRKTPMYTRTLTKIFYGSSSTASAIPFIPSSSLGAEDRPHKGEHSPRSKSRDLNEPWIPPYRPITVPLMSPRAPASPRTPRHHRPVTCGGPTIVRVIKAPPQT